MAINSLSASSKGMSGLVSGIDTESIVEKMLSGTQSKIDTQNQNKTRLEYKQEMYRGVITDLLKFQDTYFNYTNQSSNLRSEALFESKSASTTSSSYAVTATTKASAGNITIDSISSLASKYKQTTKTSASSILGGTIDSQKLQDYCDSLNNDNIIFKVENKTLNISLASLAGKSSLEAESVINNALKTANIDASVEYESGSFAFTTANSDDTFSIDGSETALELIGGTKISGTGSASINIDTNAVLPSISLNIDGVSKSLTFNPLDASSIADQLNSSVASAFGTGITVSETGGNISFTASNASRKITISGDSDALEILGMESGDSNKISLTDSINDCSFATRVLGQSQEFTINGVDFSFSSDDSLTGVINAINSSDAGVKVSYSSTTDKFTIESAVSGVRGEDFKITQSEGNLMTAMFGFATSGNTTGFDLNKELTQATLPSSSFNYTGGIVNLNINGNNVSLSIKKKYTTADKFISAINEALVTQFGKDDNDVANVSFQLSGDVVSLSTTADYSAFVYDDSLSVLGFDTSVSSTTTLAEMGIVDDVSFNIDGTTLTFDSSKSISDMISSINATAGSDIASFDETKAYIRIAGVDIPMDFIDSSGKIFGQTEGTLGVAASAPVPTTTDLFSVTEGSNAVMSINGVEIERNSNSFTVDGVSFSLLSTTTDASTVTVTQDTDQIYDTVVKFVEDYNTLINSMNELLDADPTYKKYDPLTTAQEDEMTETQVAKWEKKSKEGLLRNDSTLTGVLSSLRGCLYTKPEGSMALYELGITTTYFGTKDNLAISDTSKLKTLISENPEAIKKLFTDTESGLATLLNKSLDDAASISTVDTGSLVRIAGAAGKTDTKSSIYKQIKEIKTKLKSLDKKYDKEYKRYWKKFNEMESYISKMNSSSSWLSSLTSS